MKNKIKSGCIILLDDAYRREEVEIAERWATELKCSFSILGIAKPYIVMAVE
jgi:hypothetical protein